MSCDEELQGFVQCVSRIFRVKRDQTIMIKLTTDPICFCFSSQTSHVLIQWNKHEELFEDQQARIRFLNGCPIHQWIRASGLRRYRIYSGQARERVVWLFQANVSHVQVIPAPLNPPSCSQSICPSRPIGMLSTLHAVVLSVHCQGHILELTDLSYSDRPESESPVPIYWCLSSSRLSSAELCPGGHLVFHNIWYLPAPSSTGFSVGYEALLVLGVYSTCQIYQSTKPPGMQQPSSFPSPPCESRCCTDSRLVGPDAFHPINVREILSGCMHTWKSAQAHLKELNGRGSKSISKQFTDSILDRLISPDPDYQPQLAEEFINFPHLYGDSTFPDQSGFMVFTPDQFFDVFSTFPEPIESDETRFELADRQSCLVWRKRSSRRPLLDADTPSRWSWLFQESKTT
ncbi:hypothetical protein D915_000210 [Fasciola hepatica]|uniref:Uncharacterized protein n=1 Tax=Fasciola hepatica TaxID=6192 RepID=A0A4E0RPJ0_FASHE|nr:hypothetical protein D915_000210 [Fasciola hepatica]